MDDAAAFLRAVIEHPEDDGPRLVFADWLDERGDPLGDFIRTQCEYACLPPRNQGGPDPHHSERVRLFLRWWGLYKDNEKAWLAAWQRRGAERCIFRRGFVEEATMTAAAWIEHAAEIMSEAPLRVLTLSQLRPAA